MKKQILKIFIKGCSFFLIFFLLLMQVSNVLETTEVPKQGIANSFYAQKRNSLDIIFVGSCHAYDTYSPLSLWKDSGVTSHVFASPGQDFQSSYYYIKEALKTQTPEIIVLETFSATKYKSYLDDASLSIHPFNVSTSTKLSLDKIKWALSYQGIDDLDPSKLIFNITEFHNRWSELTQNDFSYLTEEELVFKGYIDSLQVLENSKDVQSAYFDPFNYNIKTKELANNNDESFRNYNDISETEEIDSVSLEYLYKIIELSKEENFELIFTLSPYTITYESEINQHNVVKQIAADNDLPYINYNDPDVINEIDLRFSDMADEYHTNLKGSIKVTKYLSSFIKANYNLDDKRNSDEYKKWDNDIIYIYQDLNKMSLSTAEDAITYLDNLIELKDDYTIIIAAKDEASIGMTDEISEKLTNLGLIGDLRGKYRYSYLTVIEKGSVIYESLDTLERKFETILDGKTLQAISNCTIESPNASIKIDNHEIALNKRGLNIVVYDNITHKAVSTVVIDLYDDAILYKH